VSLAFGPFLSCLEEKKASADEFPLPPAHAPSLCPLAFLPYPSPPPSSPSQPLPHPTPPTAFFPSLHPTFTLSTLILSPSFLLPPAPLPALPFRLTLPFSSPLAPFPTLLPCLSPPPAVLFAMPSLDRGRFFFYQRGLPLILASEEVRGHGEGRNVSLGSQKRHFPQLV